MIIIGDVHGCIKTLEALLKKLPENDTICFTGDLIDRGPGSREVVELVMERGYDCVLGNHEYMMLAARRALPKEKANPYAGLRDAALLWEYNGGVETAESYGGWDFPQEHLDWMNTLPAYKSYSCANEKGLKLLVSHSMVARGNRLEDAEERLWRSDSIIWHRGDPEEFTQYYHVFGHTPHKDPRVENTWACIDSGCVYPNEGYGKLTALLFPQLELIQQERLDDLNLE